MRQSLMYFLFLFGISFGCSKTVDVTPPATTNPSATPVSATESTRTDAGTNASEPAAK